MAWCRHVGRSRRPRHRFGRAARARLDCSPDPRGVHLINPPRAGRQQGSVSSGGCGGPLCLGPDRSAACRRAGGSVGLAAVASVRGARSLSQIPARDLRRGGGAGARHRAAADRAGGRPDQPRLPVLRPSRLREDVIGADSGPLAELRRRGRHRIRAGCADRASRWRRKGPGSLDVVELDAASHGGVDDTRDLRDKAFYMPAESRYRVFIIDEAHMVTTQGFNALLKIVEEPPEHLVFIFATTEPDKVLTTIRSRTHHYPFRLIPPDHAADAAGAAVRRRGRDRRTGGVPAGDPGRRWLGPGFAVGARPAAGRGRAGGRHLPQRGGAARGHRCRAAGRGGRRARRRPTAPRCSARSTGWSRPATTRDGSPPICCSGCATW